MGAIDPARVSVVLQSAINKRSLGADGGDKASKSSIKVVEAGNCEDLTNFNLAPWELTPTEMSFILLEQHLVPSLKGLSHMIVSDKTGFAIQTILRSIAHFELPQDDHSQALKTPAATFKGDVGA